jgi:hypothetical protein
VDLYRVAVLANIYDLKLAIYEIARKDTTPTVGLVALTGKTVPVVPRGTEIEQDLPTVAMFVTSAPISTKTPEKRLARVNFDIRVKEDDADGLEETIADRLRSLMTYTGLAAEGLDVSPRELDRFDLTQLAPNGEVRKGVDYHMELTT